VADKLQCQGEMDNPYDVYMLVMHPTAFLAMMMVLTTLKVHWDRV
jgi:hypothetical protein